MMRCAPRSLASLLAMFGALVGAVRCHADAGTAPTLGIDIMSAGIFETDPGRKEAASEGVLGFIRRHDHYRLVEATERICARIGRNFGVEFRLNGPVPGTVVDLTHVSVFPAPGLARPDGTMITSSRFHDKVATGTLTYRSFTFDEPWEMVDGMWTFEVHAYGRLIGSHRFMVMTRCEIS